MTGSRRTVKSAARVLDIFELLLQERRGLSLSDLSERLGIPASSAHELVRTITTRGYLVRGDDLLIRLGPRLGQFTRVFVDGIELIDVAKPVLEQVNELCGQTVSLAVLEGREVVFIYKEIGRGTLHVVNPVGTRLPAHSTGLGKAILGLLPPRELNLRYPFDHLEALTPNTLADKASLISALECVRRAGTAYDREESALGIFAVGSAIQDNGGKPVAVISIVLPAAQASEALQARWAALIKTAAIVISYRLGYAGLGLSEAMDEDLLKSAWERGESLAQGR